MNRELKSIIYLLKDYELSHNSKLVKDALGKLLDVGNEGCNISEALPFVIKVLPANDIVIKKLCCLILIKYGHKFAGTNLLTHNTIQQEFQDPNPLVRCLMLKTSCCLRDENYEGVLRSGLTDDSAQVRRSSILNCAKLKKFHDSSCEAQVIEQLYISLRDEDPLVITNCLSALDEMLRAENGVALNRHIVSHLLSQIGRFSRWGQLIVLRILSRYQPETESELFDVLNVLNPLFNSSSCSVVIQTYQLFKRFLHREKPKLLISALQQTCANLKKFLNDENPELNYLILQFVREEGQSDTIGSLLPSLLTRYGESSCVKVTKLDILCQICNENNFEQIFEDVCVHLTDSNEELSDRAVSTLGAVASSSNPNVFHRSVSKLFQLLNVSDSELKSRSLWVLQQLDLRKLENSTSFAQHIHRLKYFSLSSSPAKCSFLWLLGEYGTMIPAAPYILEEIGLEYSINTDLDFTIGVSLLICALKLFSERPFECQPVLGRIFEMCFEQDSAQLRDEVIYYYRLLKNDYQLCLRTVCCQVEKAELQ